ncbi:MAG: hypothetical protein WCC04_20765 [Terriglobales bacterium]
MNERDKKAFDFAADLTKQLITLSTSIVTLTFLFSKDLQGPKWLAVVIWMLFLLSTVCGLWTLMSLTGTLAPLPRHQSNPPPQTPPAPNGGQVEDGRPLEIGNNVRVASKWQIFMFGAAILLTLAYVPLAFLRHPPPLACTRMCPCVANQSQAQ